MKNLVACLCVTLVEACFAIGEDLYATSNYWGSTRAAYRERVFDAVAFLSTNSDGNVVRNWYCDLVNLPNIDDGTAPLPWLEEKAFLMYFYSTVPPIRSSTNCWFAAADAWGSCRALLAQCEADFTRARGCSFMTNTSFAEIEQSKERFRTRWNRLVSVRKAEPLLADVVTNKFPCNISRTISEDEMRDVQRRVYSRSGMPL